MYMFNNKSFLNDLSLLIKTFNGQLSVDDFTQFSIEVNDFTTIRIVTLSTSNLTTINSNALLTKALRQQMLVNAFNIFTNSSININDYNYLSTKNTKFTIILSNDKTYYEISIVFDDLGSYQTLYK